MRESALFVSFVGKGGFTPKWASLLRIHTFIPASLDISTGVHVVPRFRLLVRFRQIWLHSDGLGLLSRVVVCVHFTVVLIYRGTNINREPHNPYITVFIYKGVMFSTS